VFSADGDIGIEGFNAQIDKLQIAHGGYKQNAWTTTTTEEKGAQTQRLQS